MESTVAKIIAREADRQSSTIELIASENHVSPAVMEAVGSCLTNKYAEGYPGKRYYGGCQNYDEVERLAQERAQQLFGCAYANVQPHSGASANIAAFFAFMQPGDRYASLVLSDGGHLSHGLKINISGKYFEPVHYPLVYDTSRPDFETIDYDALRDICLEHKPKMVLCGYSAYPRIIDFARMREVADECGAVMMADIAHIAGLVAGGVHPSPFPHAHVVTTTTHKTLRGPRGGLILSDDEKIATKIDRAVFPGSQGGPLMHVIAGKAVCFGEALRPEFGDYAAQVVTNAQKLAAALIGHGFRLVSDGTDNHLMLVDLRERVPDNTGKEVAGWLEQAGMIANHNGIPKDPRPPMQTSGIRLGTPAVTTRGMREPQMARIAAWIDRAVTSGGDEAVLANIREEVREFCTSFPLPH
ncbi:MAG: serine hydroxymethyltransferase [Candidatus Poseidoniia archaeon]|jgi:glycine hydroxymethyltransferase|nr:serine hydroxymethyltransferase [Candidatus Poseidoniia archaeon]MDP7473642.1 serine hydroxymethyltransferase [Candidatus Poseidoniia archaeon]MDP7607983.1 serine hydroxymethyltransferase [Candidatus Poseidoniia archaeon]